MLPVALQPAEHNGESTPLATLVVESLRHPSSNVVRLLATRVATKATVQSTLAIRRAALAILLELDRQFAFRRSFIAIASCRPVRID
jgi:hypothetical protein